VIASPLRPRDRQERGIAAAGRLAHPGNALRRFTLVRHHGTSMASFRPALTEAHLGVNPTAPASRPVNSGPRPCLFDAGFPLSGLQDRTYTSDLNVRARHTCARPPGSLRSAPAERSPDSSPPTANPEGSNPIVLWSPALPMALVLADMAIPFAHAYTDPRTLPSFDSQPRNGATMPKMGAVQVSEAGSPFELVERDIPQPRFGEALVRVDACGVCHSDVLATEGGYPGSTIRSCPATRSPGDRFTRRRLRVAVELVAVQRGISPGSRACADPRARPGAVEREDRRLLRRFW
jgi:hypothetical protein